MKLILELARRAALFLAAVYAAGLILLTILWTGVAAPPWWLALAQIFAAWLFLPLPLCLLVAVVSPSRRLLALVGVACLCSVALFGPLWLPRPRAEGAGGTLRVATFNHHYENRSPEAVAAVVAKHEADIVALQELSPAVAEHLSLALRDQYPYQWLLPAENASGLGIISRYPLREQRVEPEFRGQHVVVDVDGRALTLLNAHPNTPFPKLPRGDLPVLIATAQQYDQGSRSAQVRALLGRVRAIEGPLIVLGDFNTSESERVYHELAAELTDVYRATTPGFGFTYPSAALDVPLPVAFPLVRIDYIWVNGALSPVRARVDCQASGSDHCLLTADVALR